MPFATSDSHSSRLWYIKRRLTRMQKTAHAHDGQLSATRPCIANRFTPARRKSRFAHVLKSAFLDFDILRISTENVRSVAFFGLVFNFKLKKYIAYKSARCRVLFKSLYFRFAKYATQYSDNHALTLHFVGPPAKNKSLNLYFVQVRRRHFIEVS